MRVKLDKDNSIRVIPADISAIRTCFGVCSTVRVIVVKVEGGYMLRFQEWLDSYCELQAEKSKKPRVFRTVEAALNVCRALGFTSVTVEL